MAYGIIVQAARVSDTLKAELGALSRDYNIEDDWLQGVQKHFQAILTDPKSYVEFWNLEEEEGVTAPESWISLCNCTIKWMNTVE